MTVQAYFKNIKYHLVEELKKSTESIYVAVAWFTDAHLFQILCDKAKSGLCVELMIMNDDITKNSSINYQLLQKAGGKIFLIDDDVSSNLMHNKFCVIDKSVTITGSYNWSYKAQNNHENITVTYDNSDLADAFISEFQRLRKQYFGINDLTTFDADVITKRLAIIKTLIELTDYVEIEAHKKKIEKFETKNGLDNILDALRLKDYKNAGKLIEAFLVRVKSIAIFEDSDMEQLRWQIKYLEIEVVTLESEKCSIEKLLADFLHEYTLRFGDLLLKILSLKKEHLKFNGNKTRSAEYEEAEKQYKEQKEKNEYEKGKNVNNLNDDEKEQLKQNYRTAVRLCHPDKFSDEESKEKAHKIFVELQDAYSKNDLARVNDILERLENGLFDIENLSDTQTTRDSLMKKIAALKKRIDELDQILVMLKNNAQYKDIVSIKDMDQFFESEKQKLETELNNLENEQ